MIRQTAPQASELVTPPVCPVCGRVIVTGEPRVLVGGGQVQHLMCRQEKAS